MSVAVLLAAALAAPLPKPADPERVRVVKLFGEPVDPDGDCSFSLDGDRLTIDVPDEMHHLIGRSPALSNAPRTARPMAGDFTATVRVRLRLPAGHRERTDQPGGYAAGLVARANDGRAARVACGDGWTASGPGGVPPAGWRERFDWYILAARGVGWTAAAELAPERTAWVRLVRRNDALEFGHWTAGEPRQSPRTSPMPDLAGPVHVGVFAAHTAAGFDATFDRFTLEPSAPSAK